MVILLLVSLSAAAACAGSAAAVHDARSQTWRMARYGCAGFVVAMMGLIGLLAGTGSGSIFYTTLLAPLAASFVALYLVTRIVAVVVRPA